MGKYLRAGEAAGELGVSVNTLYAYVSRGLVRSEAGAGSSRERRYHAEDVEKLKQRKEQRGHPERAAEGALYWGTPVLESAISQVLEGRLFYRGRDAVELARSSTAEAVAHFMWTGSWNGSRLPGVPGTLPDPPAGLMPVERFQAVLPVMAAGDPGAHDLSAEQSLKTGSKIWRAMGLIAVGAGEGAGTVEVLRRAWAPENELAERLFDATLILCADHELNTSSFTARCVASTGASLYGAVAAGLYALQGFRHGGSTERVERFVDEVAEAKKPERVIGTYLKRGESVPGFGHPLYPEADPRAVCLLGMLRESGEFDAEMERAAGIENAMEAILESRPNMDFALVTLERCLKLPAGSALCLFALGRTVGWIAHAMEQYATGVMIRPRARYVGVTAF